MALLQHSALHLTTAPPRSLSSRRAGEHPKYLTPSEVLEILRRMWELNEPLLAYLYPTGGRQRGVGWGAGGGRAGDAGAKLRVRCEVCGLRAAGQLQHQPGLGHSPRHQGGEAGSHLTGT